MEITRSGPDLPTDDPIALAKAINRLPRPRFWLRVPSAGDLALAATLDAVRAAPPPFREAVAAAVDDGGAGVLGNVAARLSALAVRTGEPVHLERALLALALAAQGTEDIRDVLITVPVPGHSARLLGLDPAALYAAAAADAPAMGAQVVRWSKPPEHSGPISRLPGRRAVRGGGGRRRLPVQRLERVRGLVGLREAVSLTGRR